MIKRDGNMLRQSIEIGATGLGMHHTCLGGYSEAGYTVRVQ